jgi:hypothetical protein
MGVDRRDLAQSRPVGDDVGGWPVLFHGGVDWGEMRMLVTDTLDGESTRGGSTIPMQTAKNLFLWNSRSFVRKAMELPLAVAAISSGRSGG